MQPVMAGKNPRSPAAIHPSEATPPDLRIQLLGQFTVWVHGERISEEALHSRRVRSLIKLLALAPGCRLSRDQIIDALWPESDLTASTNNFHQTLHAARKVLCPDGPARLILREGILHLLDGQQPDLDVDAFESAANSLATIEAAPDDYWAALTLYSGDLLPDDLYEEWTIQRRTSLRELYFRLLMNLAAAHEYLQQFADGIEALHKLLASDPSNEGAHAMLMRQYALNGQRRDALKQYDQLAEVLHRELDVEPNESTKKLRQQIHSGLVGPLPTPFDQPHSNLPAELSSLIGREHEIETLKTLLLSERSHLVTVSGAGGVGKTRLALRAARELHESFTHGIWFVDLASLENPVMVAITVVKTLGILENPNVTPTQALLQYLNEKRVLLLLDNCEHVMEAAASLVETLLKGCPKIAILCTSREVLRVAGEITFRCPSLRLPDPAPRPGYGELPAWQEQADSEAVRLFAERAVLVDPNFMVAAGNIHTVVNICQRLDGIPLAIEMAAARLRLLSLEQIAARLDHAFQLLTGGMRTELPRHRTLKAMIDWSYDLLPEKEKQLLRRLSVFMGGWTLEAAERVGADGLEISPGEVLDLLGHLEEKSLLQVEPDPSQETRYRMLEPVRQYALDRLCETEGEAAARDRHLDFFTDLSERAEPHLRAWGMVEWLERLDQELGNIRHALEWAQGHSFAQGLRIASALMWFWHIHGRRFEGIAWIKRLLTPLEAGDQKDQVSIGIKRIHGRALFSLGYLQFQAAVGQVKEGYNQIRKSNKIFELLEESGRREALICESLLIDADDYVAFKSACLLHIQRLKDIGEIFFAAELLTRVIMREYATLNYPGAIAYEEDNLAVRREIGDIDGEAYGLFNQNYFWAETGNIEKAKDCVRASQAGFLAIKNMDFYYFSLLRDGEFPLLQGDYEFARKNGEWILAYGREMSNKLLEPCAYEMLIRAAWFLKEYEQAQQLCDEARIVGVDEIYCDWLKARISLSQGDYLKASIGFKKGSLFHDPFLFRHYFAIQDNGILASAQGKYRRAAILLGAQSFLCPTLIFCMSPFELDEYHIALASSKAALGQTAFQSAWEEGGKMSYDQIKAYALEDPETD